MLTAFLAFIAPVSAQPATLDPFARFIGSCWSADFSPTMRDVHCFEPMFGSAHVRDRHEVKDGQKAIYAGETIYTLDGTVLAFTYVNSLGGLGRGTVQASGDRLRFTGNMRPSPDKLPQPIDSEWRIVDDDHYEVRSLVPSASTGGNSVLRFSRLQ